MTRRKNQDKHPGGRPRKKSSMTGAERAAKHRQEHPVAVAARERHWKRTHRARVRRTRKKRYQNILKPLDQQLGRGWREDGYWTEVSSNSGGAYPVKRGQRNRAAERMTREEKLAYHREQLKEVDAQIRKQRSLGKTPSGKLIGQRSTLIYRIKNSE